MEKKTLEEMGTEMTGLTVKNTIVKETEDIVYGFMDYTGSNYPIGPGQYNYVTFSSRYDEYNSGIISATGINTTERLAGVIVNFHVYDHTNTRVCTIYNASNTSVNMMNIKLTFILFK